MDNFIGIVDYLFVIISQFFQLMLSNWLLMLVLIFGIISIIFNLMLIIGGKNN